MIGAVSGEEPTKLTRGTMRSRTACARSATVSSSASGSMERAMRSAAETWSASSRQR